MSQPEEPAFQDLLEEFRQQVEEDETPRNDDDDNTPFSTDNDGGTGHDGKAGN